MNRRQFLTAAGAASLAGAQKSTSRPNVILIMTDDQGYGDVGLHGNPAIRTPAMDRIAREGVQFTQFHVSPVCSPTRASLMTGRYNYRTGIVDTFLGRSLMRPNEVTVAALLGRSGYRTGIFGKWHLGDNYPLRPLDRGFQESVVIRGGGLGQPSDFPGGGSYFNPICLRNGQPERFEGYCTDIFFREAMRFIEKNRQQPFFVYLPTNAPHTPLEVADEEADPYRKQGSTEETARIYGMVTNADRNIGALLAKLKELGLEENTMVIFMTDNGPQQRRYNGDMRGLKGTTYEGGIRVPFFLRWPGRVRPGTKVDRLAAHIDVLPTLLEACSAPPPSGVKLDGRSLMPLLRDPSAKWEDRTLCFQWHRGDAPELYRACAARNQRWKMVNGKELYDLETDPAESRDVAAEKPEILQKLRAEYEAWFRDVTSAGFEPVRIVVGSQKENPVTLTRQDWRGGQAGWDKNSVGHWEIQVERPGRYECSVRFAPQPGASRVTLSVNGQQVEKQVEKQLEAGAGEAVLGVVQLQAGAARVTGRVSAGEAVSGVHYVTLRRV